MNSKKKLSITEQRKKIPIVKGYLSEYPNSEGWRLFTFWCPFCRCNHTHGYPAVTSRRKYAEHRVAHCGLSPFNEFGYFLQPYTAKEIQEMPTKISTSGVKESSTL